MTTGEKIAQLRKKFSLTQPMLAEKMSVSQSTITSWENNRRNISNEDLIKLAEIFNVSTDYLLGIVPKKQSSTKQDTSEDLKRMVDNAMSFDGKPLSDHDKDVILSYLEGRFGDK